MSASGTASPGTLKESATVKEGWLQKRGEFVALFIAIFAKNFMRVK